MSDNPTISQPHKIESLEALRGFSAFLIVGYHWAYMLNGVYPSFPGLGWNLFIHGFIGVDIFFVISGVVMVVSTASERSQNAMTFMIRRFFRLVPLLWAMLLLTTLMSQKTWRLDLTNISDAFFFILPGGTPPQYGRGAIDVVWTLTYEVIFYCIFGLALLIAPKLRVHLATLFILIMVFGLQMLYGHITLNTDEAPLYAGTLYPKSMLSLMANPYFLEFVAGMWLGFIYLKLPAKKTYWASVAGFSLIFIFFYKYFHYIAIENKLFSCLIWAWLFVAGALIWERMGYLKIPKVLIMFGSLTYALYLSHVPLSDFLNNTSLASLTAATKFGAYCAVAILLATLLYCVIERPFIKMGQQISRYIEGKLQKH